MDKDRIYIIIHADGHIASIPPNDMPDDELDKLIDAEKVRDLEIQIQAAEETLGIGEIDEN
ncbi:MAG: hypothetical protein HQ556_01770 [Candidatus Marinimicrobia bacterium]|nr:hypothetical protein [Candidatus Neomarinimicrobiota bacterium]